MRVQNAATGNTGVWATFLAVVVLYIGVGVTTVLVLRGMSRRYREQAGGAGGPGSESDVPYGPSDPPPTSPTGAPEKVGAG
jgi:cytochrome d ubiquinol oxidase subunit I